MQKGLDKASVITLHRQNSQQNEVVSVKEKLVQLPTPVLRLREISQKQLEAAIQNMFDHVDDALFELADRAASNLEQNLFFESMRDIRIQRRNMEQCFLTNLDKHFVNLLDAENTEAPQAEPQTDSDEMSLVSKDELEELVAIDSLVTKAWSHNKGALKYLALRLNTLVLAGVTEKSNPVSPRALADSFGAAAKLANIDIKAKLVLFKLFERHVMNHLGELLDHMNVALTELGISVPQKSSAKPDYSPKASYSAPASRPQPQAPQVPLSGQSTSDIKEENTDPSGLYATLQSLMQSQGRRKVAKFTESSYASHSEADYGVSEISSQLLQGLSQLQLQQVNRTQASEMPQGQPQLIPAAAIASAIQGSMGKDLIDDRSGNVIKLVDMLFSFILEDRNLPNPIKLLLSRLQIPFIKVALADDNFFKKDGHSARRLLNEMATASIGWAGDINSGNKDPLYDKIETIVEKVLREFDNNFEIFTILLTDFVAFIEKERRRVMLFEKRALDAEGGKAKAEMGRKAVDAELSQLIAGAGLPDMFKQFLRGPWSNILFLIYMRQGEGSQQWEQALMVAERLVWSAKPIENDAHREELKKLLPKLRNSLQKGLDNISFNSAKQSKVFDVLKAHHQSLFQAYLSPSKKPVQQPVEEEARVPMAKAKVAKPGITMEQLEEELKGLDDIIDGSQPVAAVETILPLEQVATSPVAEQQVASEPIVETPVESNKSSQQYLNLVDNFVVGVWFEKMGDGNSLFRCLLAAIIRGTGKYIFVNRAGVKVAEESRESLAMLLQAGHLRTLDDGMLFDRALESVIESLRQD